MLTTFLIKEATNLNLLTKTNNTVERVQFSQNDPDNNNQLASNRSQSLSTIGIGSNVFPTPLKASKGAFLTDNYQLLAGTFPKKATDLVLVTDNKNTVDLYALKNLGFKITNNKQLAFKSLIGKEFKIAANNDYYQELPNGLFTPKKVTQTMYDNAQTTLKLTAVIRPKNADSMSLLANGIVYSDQLAQDIIAANQNSAIVKAQKASSQNVLTGQTIRPSAKQSLLEALGGSSLPTGIMIYPNNFSAKDKVLNYLDKWNQHKAKKDQIIYTDMSSVVTSMTGGLLTGITTILVAFAGISLITSMIMIGILTYTSVLERTKEIGVLKALGARKKDITRVFDAETFILGSFAGVLGVGIAALLTFPINSIIYHLTSLKDVAQLNPVHAILLILISTILTLIGGHLPARIAAKKDAATALRSE